MPWDDQVNSPAPRRAHPHGAAGQHWAGLLAPGTVAAYTALAGVLVAALAGPAEPGEADLQAAHAGQALL